MSRFLVSSRKFFFESGFFACGFEQYRPQAFPPSATRCELFSILDFILSRTQNQNRHHPHSITAGGILRQGSERPSGAPTLNRISPGTQPEGYMHLHDPGEGSMNRSGQGFEIMVSNGYPSLTCSHADAFVGPRPVCSMPPEHFPYHAFYGLGAYSSRFPFTHHWRSY